VLRRCVHRTADRSPLPSLDIVVISLRHAARLERGSGPAGRRLHALRAAGRRLGIRLRDLAVVGDDPELEVPMAHRGRALAVAVGTGIGTADAFARCPSAPPPAPQRVRRRRPPHAVRRAGRRAARGAGTRPV